MASWKNNYDPALIADLIESSKKITKDGNISFEGFGFSEYMVVLPSMIDWNSIIPNIEKNRIIRRATYKSGENGEINTESLITHINRLEREYIKKSPTKFKLITGISISKTCDLPHTRIDGSTIVLNPKINNKIRNEREKTISKALKSFSAPLPTNYSHISVSVNARSKAEAADLALDRLDFIRGLWNLSKNRGNTFRMSFGQRKPINSLVLFPVHTLHKPKGGLITDSYWWEPQYQGEIRKFSKQSDLDKMHNYMKSFRSKLMKCNYKTKIESAIIRYVRALDSLHWENSFLHLWGILESLTNTTGDKYKITIK